MIALTPHALTPNAQQIDVGEFQPTEFGGIIASASQTVALFFGGEIATASQTVRVHIQFGGIIASASQTLGMPFGGIVATCSQTVLDASSQGYQFGRVWGDFGAFGLRLYTDLGDIDLCRLRSLSVEHEEGMASKMSFSLRVELGQPIDLFQYLNKKITLELMRPSMPPHVLFDGVLDSSGWDVGGVDMQWNALSARSRAIDSMSDGAISGIGLFDENVFKKLSDYDNKRDLVEDRLSTIPASLDFRNGNPIITSWFPKQTADYTIKCGIFHTGINNSVLSQDQIVNSVDVNVKNAWELQHHLERFYSFDSGYTVCDYSTKGLPPSNATVQTAAKGTGWIMSNYQSVGLHEGGIYRCRWDSGGIGRVWWNPRGGTFTAAETEDDRYRRSVTDHTNVYAQSATFKLSKRWNQPINETITQVRKNNASIMRYGERKKTVNVNVEHDITQSSRVQKHWENYTTYANPSRQGATNAGNGHYYLRGDNINKGALEAALNVAGRVADVMILESHRSIELSMSLTKIAPQIDVTQTHDVNFENITGTFKCSRVAHNFDVINPDFSRTSLTYKIFSNAENGTYAPQNIAPNRADLQIDANLSYDSRLKVNDILDNSLIFYSDEEYEEYLAVNGKLPSFTNVFYYYKLRGLVNKVTQNEFSGEVLTQEEDFQVIADEVPEQLTDTMEISTTQTVFIGIPNNSQDLTA